MTSQVQLVQQDLKRNLNINVKITKLDYTTYYGRYVESKWDGMAWGFQSGHAVGLDERTYQYMHSKSTKNFFRVNDPLIDELTTKLRQTPDRGEQRTIARKIVDRDPIDDLPGDRALLAAVGSLPQLGGQLVDERIVHAEEVLGGLRVHVLVRPLVETHRVARLEPPGHPVPFALDVTAVVRRVVELGDLDVDIEVSLQVLLHELHLRGHLREILVVEQRGLESVGVSGLRQELLGFRGAVPPPGAELGQRRHLVLVVDVGDAPAGDAVPLEERVDLFLAVDGHGDGAPHPDVAEGLLVLREGQTEGRQHVLVFLDDRRGVGLAHGLDLAQARQPEDVALPRAERRQAGRGVRGRENGVLVDVRPALVEVVGVPREDHPHLAGVLLQEVGSGADQALLEIAVLFEDLTREDHRDGLGEVLREQHIGRLQVHAQGVLVGRLHPLDLAEREGLHAFLRVGLEAVLDVRRHQLAPVQRRHVVPLDPLAQLERPHPVVGARLPQLREVSLEREVVGATRLVGERVADETVAGEGGKLEEPDRLRQPWIEHRRVPGRGPRQEPPPPGRV